MNALAYLGIILMLLLYIGYQRSKIRFLEDTLEVVNSILDKVMPVFLRAQIEDLLKDDEEKKETE